MVKIAERFLPFLAICVALRAAQMANPKVKWRRFAPPLNFWVLAPK